MVPEQLSSWENFVSSGFSKLPYSKLNKLHGKQDASAMSDQLLNLICLFTEREEMGFKLRDSSRRRKCRRKNYT